MRVQHVVEGSPWPTGYRSDQVEGAWMPGEIRNVKRPLGLYLVATFVGVFVDLAARPGAAAEDLDILPDEPIADADVPPAEPPADPFEGMHAGIRDAITAFVDQAPEVARAQLRDGIVAEFQRFGALTAAEQEQAASPEARQARALRWVELGASPADAAAFEGLAAEDVPPTS